MADRPAVVVCYRDRTDLLGRCLAALRRQTRPLELLLVDDHSSHPVAPEPGGAIATVRLLRNERWRGYTVSANRGLAAAEADRVVLLNSDTAAAADAVEQLCTALDSGAGLAGPVSNAATWQSIPARFARGGRWSANPVLHHIDPDRVAKILAGIVEREVFPVPLLNGFCIALRHETLERVGTFDAAAFPVGYGEENDLCIRAGAAGFALAVVPRAYVYHAKSGSFGHLRRWWYSRRGGRSLAAKWGQSRIEALCRTLGEHAGLAALRRRFAEALTDLGHGPVPWD